MYRRIENSSMAEQKNSFLDQLRSQCAYMKQTTFLWYLRYFLVLQNRQQEPNEQPFWHKKPRREAGVCMSVLHACAALL